MVCTMIRFKTFSLKNNTKFFFKLPEIVSAKVESLCVNGSRMKI